MNTCDACFPSLGRIVAVTILCALVLSVPASSMQAAGMDSDEDRIPDRTDNCPAAFNSGQEDADKDGVGDACDSCPTVPDPKNECGGRGTCKEAQALARGGHQPGELLLAFLDCFDHYSKLYRKHALEPVNPESPFLSLYDNQVHKVGVLMREVVVPNLTPAATREFEFLVSYSGILDEVVLTEALLTHGSLSAAAKAEKGHTQQNSLKKLLSDLAGQVQGLTIPLPGWLGGPISLAGLQQVVNALMNVLNEIVNIIRPPGS